MGLTWWTAVALVALASSAACQRPLPDERPGPDGAGLVQQAEGCWRLAPAGDDEASREAVRRWVREGALPEVVQLDTTRAEMGGGDGHYVAWSYVHSRRQRRPLAAWRPVGADSIRVETPGALSGTVLRLAVGDGLLEGTAGVFSDVVEPGEERGGRTAPVEARREDCPR